MIGKEDENGNIGENGSVEYHRARLLAKFEEEFPGKTPSEEDLALFKIWRDFTDGRIFPDEELEGGIKVKDELDRYLVLKDQWKNKQDHQDDTEIKP